ncbi:MAG TPA: hypothetical protein PLW50_00780 [Smithellaceae bacterium]|nr:hypothetical protein [Smithellaceae bacterium]
MSKEDTNAEGTLENQEVGDQVFNDAFDAAEGGAAPAAGEEAAGQSAQAASDAEASTAGDAQPAAGNNAQSDAEAAAEAQRLEEEKYEQRYKSLVGVHKHDKESWEAEKADLVAKLEAATKVPATPTQEELAAKAKPSGKSLYESFRDSLTPEQKEELDEYERDFDIVSKMEGLKRDKAMEAFENRLKQFQDEILSKLTPAQELFTKVADEREAQLKEQHFGTIAGAHPDYEKYRDDGSILKWIESKPGYLRKGMLDVYQAGEAQEVADLISDFKKENNIEQSQSSANSQVVDLQSKREAKRQAMQSVTGRRGSVNPATVVASDFEGAFEEALNK